MSSSLRRYLLTARAPRTAAGFVDDSFAVVDLRRNRNGFSLASSALTPLPPGLITPSFDAVNIQDPAALTEIISQTVEAAGLSRKKRWSVALPEGSARTLVISLESKPSSRNELNEVLSWKIERVIATPTSELRISRQRMKPEGGHERYLVGVALETVASEYEAIFEGLRWEAGLVLPRHLGEAQWLMWDDRPGDKMLVSANRSGFTSVIVRNGEPALVRSYACEAGSMTDELHRFALYYRDRLATAGQPAHVTGLLVLGGIDLSTAGKAIGDALEAEPRNLDPSEFGLDLRDEPITFDQLACAAGLATLAWQ